MKAVHVLKFDDMSLAAFGEVPTPIPLENEVLVKIVCAGVNPIDWKLCQGALDGAFPHEFPLIPGWDVSGVVSSIGSKVTKFKVGDVVLGEIFRAPIQRGGYAEFVAADEASLALKPSDMTFEQAAALPLVALTAFQGLTESLKIKSGETILVTGGSGGVGHMAIQIAKNLGATVHSTASQANQTFVKSLGAEIVLDHSVEGYPDQFAALVAQNIDCVFNTSAGASLLKIAPHFKKGTRVCSIAARLDATLVAKRELSFGSIFIRPDGAQLAALCADFVAGNLRVEVEQVFDLADFQKAFARSKQGKVRGKLVLKV